MNLFHSISEASLIGCAVNSLALAAFVRKKELRRLFPAMMVYLAVKVVSEVVLDALIHVHLFAPWLMYNIYFSVYWLFFFVGSVALYYSVRQAVDHVMEPLPGLQKLGGVLFRWIAISSAIVVVASALHPYGVSRRAIPIGMLELMRCVSVLELCLLAFLALSVHKLGLSYKSHVFGIGLGLGMLATTDCVVSVLARFGASMVSSVNLFGEIGSGLAFALWVGYFLTAEPVRRGLTMPSTSQLLRWNEIAMAFGHNSGQVVMMPAPKPFFLEEVEKTVDRVMSRNSIDAN